MKIRFLSFFILFFLAIPLSAQKTNPYLREFGLDLLWAIVTASGHEPVSSDVELIFKESHDNLDLRFKFILSSNFRDRRHIRSSVKDSIQIHNYYHPQKTIAVNLGVGYKKVTRELPIYIGTDVHVGWNTGDTEVDRCFIGASCKRFQGLSNQHFTLGLVPFLGTKLPLTDRLMFTIEFGTQLNYHFGKRSYLDADENVREYRINGLDLEFNRLVNDIAVVYLF